MLDHGADARSFETIVAAGPIANFILAIAIFAGVFMISGKQTTTARVDAIQEGSAAQAAGFKAGDLVVEPGAAQRPPAVVGLGGACLRP